MPYSPYEQDIPNYEGSGVDTALQLGIPLALLGGGALGAGALKLMGRGGKKLVERGTKGIRDAAAKRSDDMLAIRGTQEAERGAQLAAQAQKEEALLSSLRQRRAHDGILNDIASPSAGRLTDTPMAHLMNPTALGGQEAIRQGGLKGISGTGGPQVKPSVQNLAKGPAAEKQVTQLSNKNKVPAANEPTPPPVNASQSTPVPDPSLSAPPPAAPQAPAGVVQKQQGISGPVGGRGASDTVARNPGAAQAGGVPNYVASAQERHLAQGGSLTGSPAQIYQAEQAAAQQSLNRSENLVRSANRIEHTPKGVAAGKDHMNQVSHQVQQLRQAPGVGNTPIPGTGAADLRMSNAMLDNPGMKMQFGSAGEHGFLAGHKAQLPPGARSKASPKASLPSGSNKAPLDLDGMFAKMPPGVMAAGNITPSRQLVGAASPKAAPTTGTSLARQKSSTGAFEKMPTKQDPLTLSGLFRNHKGNPAPAIPSAAPQARGITPQVPTAFTKKPVAGVPQASTQQPLSMSGLFRGHPGSPKAPAAKPVAQQGGVQPIAPKGSAVETSAPSQNPTTTMSSSPRNQFSQPMDSKSSLNATPTSMVQNHQISMGKNASRAQLVLQKLSGLPKLPNVPTMAKPNIRIPSITQSKGPKNMRVGMPGQQAMQPPSPMPGAAPPPSPVPTPNISPVPPAGQTANLTGSPAPPKTAASKLAAYYGGGMGVINHTDTTLASMPVPTELQMERNPSPLSEDPSRYDTSDGSKVIPPPHRTSFPKPGVARPDASEYSTMRMHEVFLAEPTPEPQPAEVPVPPEMMPMEDPQMMGEEQMMGEQPIPLGEPGSEPYTTDQGEIPPQGMEQGIPIGAKEAGLLLNSGVWGSHEKEIQT